ncbi:MAG: hypothetical protein ABW060_02720 [Solirubrobacteraceae bacterium]
MVPRSLLAALALVLALPVTAGAATVSIPEDDVHGVDDVEFVAGSGEANDVRLEVLPDDDDGPGEIRIRDAGAPLAPGRLCVAVDAHSVTCRPELGDPRISVDLGDGADRLLTGAALVADGGPGADQLLLTAAPSGDEEDDLPGTAVLRGGDGDDRLLGRPGPDVLVGGPGRDELHGNGSRDRLVDADGAVPAADVLDGGSGRDVVDYAGRTTALAVDLTRTSASQGAAGEGDAVLRVEDVVAGAGDDAVTGSAAANRLRGGRGDDKLRGLGGDDALVPGAGADAADGGSGDDDLWALGAYGATDDGAADRLLGATGDDEIQVGPGEALVDAGPGDDWLWGDADTAATTIGCGSGTDRYFPDLVRRPAAPPVLLRADCEGFANHGARPVRIAGGAVTFRLRCLMGEFEYADYTCRGRLRMLRDGRELGDVRFSARNDGKRLVTLPATPRLRRALRDHARVELRLSGFRDVESDFGKDRSGTFAWRIAL